MKLKKVLCLTMAGVMAFSLAACSSNTPKETNGAETTAETAAPDETGAAEDTEAPAETDGADAAGSDLSGTVKVAAVETAYGAQMWEDVAAAFEEANPGVTVELTVDKNLDDVITPDMKAGNYPDVICKSVGSESGLTETFTKDNNLADLTDVLSMTVPGEDVTVGDKILPGFTENKITNPYGDGKTYLMPKIGRAHV